MLPSYSYWAADFRSFCFSPGQFLPMWVNPTVAIPDLERPKMVKTQNHYISLDFSQTFKVEEDKPKVPLFFY